jgi:hypothetical protein
LARGPSASSVTNPTRFFVLDRNQLPRNSVSLQSQGASIVTLLVFVCFFA